MTFEIDFTLQRPEFTLAAQVSGQHRRIGLFGPSGAGKSTLVRTLAGLERGRGRIEVDGATWQSDQPPVWLPSYLRKIGWVPQSSALFPHLDVEANLRFGNNHDFAQFDQVVNTLGLGALLGRRPQTLSGGEQKRVALGRALLSQPKLLLLDEPLSGLDWPRRTELLGYLLRVLDSYDLPSIFVSHDPFEIGIFCEQVWLMESGKIVGTGTPEDIFLRPEGTSQALIAGIENIWKGSVAQTQDDQATVAVGGQRVIAERAPFVAFAKLFSLDYIGLDVASKLAANDRYLAMISDLNFPPGDNE